MAAETPFTIGAHVSCTDGPIGEVTRVVVDPVAETLTHLVVEPKGREGLARLVPLDRVEAADGEIRIRCTLTEFEQFDYGPNHRAQLAGHHLRHRAAGRGGRAPRRACPRHRR